MKDKTPSTEMAPLEALVGEWSVEALAPWAPPSDLRGRTVFEWMTGGTFLLQRWEVPIDEAPDGLAVIGRIPQDNAGYLQHYFDSRGVARVYSMTFEDGVWTLSRTKADFSPLDFAQRFTGTLGDDDRTIRGGWELAHDGSTWEHDFDLVYTRVG
ncbi:MAG TPA: hypothetical protein VKH36_16050 [Acidimicrobiia bacterium]|nr:hypothetical protein [Acidimicrobiia bacterium]